MGLRFRLKDGNQVAGVDVRLVLTAFRVGKLAFIALPGKLIDAGQQALVLCGARDGLDPLVPEAYPIAHEELLTLLERDRSPRVLEGFIAKRPYGIRAQAYRALVRIRNELTFLNMHLCDHPMRVLREEAVRAGCVTTAELADGKGQTVSIAAVVGATRRLATRHWRDRAIRDF